MPGGTRGPVPVPLQDGTRDVTKVILDALESSPALETSKDLSDIPRSETKAALDRLASRQMVQYKSNDTEIIELTAEGQQICDEGSHEYRVWDAVRRSQRLEMKDLAVSIPSYVSTLAPDLGSNALSCAAFLTYV